MVRVIYERVRISLAEVYERVGKSVLAVCVRTLKGLTDAFSAFYGCKKDQNLLVLIMIYSYLKDNAFMPVKRDATF